MKSFLGTFTEQDRAMGLQLMGYFFRKFIAQKAFQNPIIASGVNFNSMVAYYDRQEKTFISYLGKLVSQYGLQNMQISVEKAINGTAYPRMSEFSKWAANNALDSTTKTNVKFAIDAVGETASDIAEMLPTIGKVLLFTSVAYFLSIGFIAVGGPEILKKVIK